MRLEAQYEQARAKRRAKLAASREIQAKKEDEAAQLAATVKRLAFEHAKLT